MLWLSTRRHSRPPSPVPGSVTIDKRPWLRNDAVVFQAAPSRCSLPCWLCSSQDLFFTLLAFMPSKACVPIIRIQFQSDPFVPGTAVPDIAIPLANRKTKTLFCAARDRSRD